ncbi:MAG: peptidylprolyl isomerase [bacterium]
MRIRALAILFSFALVALTGPRAAAQDVIDRVLAVVDEDIVLESEVMQHLQFNLGPNPKLDELTDEQLAQFKSQILEELIRQKVLLAKARADTVTIADREIDREVEARLKALQEQLGSEEKIAEYYGMSLARIRRELRELIRENMMMEQLKRTYLGDLRVTRDEVSAFWDVYEDSIPRIEEAVRLSHILLRDEISEGSRQAAMARADSVRQMILKGEVEFEAAARRLSDDAASAKSDGLLGTTNRGDLVPEFEEVAYRLNDGVLAEPVETKFGVHLIRLNWRKGEKINTSHILFRIVPTPADAGSTMARARALREEILAGREDFAKAASRLSWDAKSAAKGGGLGWFKPEELPDDFRLPARQLAVREISEPFRSQFGIHLLRVDERQTARRVNLGEDYDRIEQMALMQKREQAFNKWINKLKAETYIEIKK